ncbi:DUF3152 domain-containing protein [Micromonospora sp. MW-13]|uniref:DUF3152 domain-containing protein n=1 Tax=Micromonospora sp. MW-13 TaxID=2094022 RepID=UPI001FB2B019|nr:DUF3152 domain-containing protein [Micromonospora sp. MW-13]
MRPARRWWRTVLPLVTLAVCVLAGVAVLAGRPSAGEVWRSPAGVAEAALDQPAPPLASAPAGPAALADPAGPIGPAVAAPGSVSHPAAPAPGGSASPMLRLPGPVPSAGRGGFRYDDRAGEVLGTSGRLRRYRVAVEPETGEDVRAFGTAVQEALAGPGSWVDGGRLRLQRVPGGAGHDFTVYLATARTAGRMCAAGGVDIRVGGRPYTSCRAPGKVIINLDRWRSSVPHFVSAGVPLAVYRTYVVNHEVGHQLGHHHERCPKPGRPAPVMMQQTLFLRGCVANPWPYLDGRRYSGPSL